MYYAHKGLATENAMTINVNGEPTRDFYTFNTKAARQEFQDKIWADSNQDENVIFCSAQYVKDTLGVSRPFICRGGDWQGRVFRSYDQYEDALLCFLVDF